jgi:hypothetical protein
LCIHGTGDAEAQIAIDSPNPETGGWFGKTVASGDVNADGKADIIVGAPGEDVGTTTGQGRAYVFDGCTRALMHTVTPPGSPGCGAAFGCRFGEAVGAGDISGDGRADIIVGAPTEDVGGSTTQGRAYVFDGVTGAPIFALDTPNPGPSANFGSAVAAGDVNGDGRPDIIVGAAGQCVSGPPPACAAGQVFVFDGTTGTLIRTLDTPNPFHNGRFGESVASGDLNGDGRADIVVGAPGEFSNQGRVYIFNGVTGGLMSTHFGIPICNLGHVACSFGFSVAVVGPTTILVGSPLDDIGGVPDQGRAYVYTPGVVAPLHILTTPSPGSGCAHECNRFGVAVAAGDVNGDGQSDFIVGANAESNKQGRVYVFNGVGGTLFRTLDSPPPVETNEILFGSTVAGGDADGAGTADIIVGAFRDDVDSVVEQGRAYLFFPPGVDVTARLDPNEKIRRGRTADVRATVTRSGIPQSCRTVTFSTADPSVASVSPTSGVTDGSGQALARVTGETRGETTVTAAVEGTTASAPVKVPDLSLIGIVLLLVCIVLIGLLRKRPQGIR